MFTFSTREYSLGFLISVVLIRMPSSMLRIVRFRMHPLTTFNIVTVAKRPVPLRVVAPAPAPTKHVLEPNETVADSILKVPGGSASAPPPLRAEIAALRQTEASTLPVLSQPKPPALVGACAGPPCAMMRPASATAHATNLRNVICLYVNCKIGLLAVTRRWIRFPLGEIGKVTHCCNPGHFRLPRRAVAGFGYEFAPLSCL